MYWGDGNSCYQIATCQALFSIPLVNSFLIGQADSGKRTSRLAELAKSLEKGKVARSSWIANDPFLAKDAGALPGQQDAADFLSRAMSCFGGDVEDGLNALFAGIYRRLTTCLSCKMETRTDQASGTLHAPLIYDKERGFCDIGQSLKSEYPDVSLIKKI